MRFDRRRDRFDLGARQSLIDLALPRVMRLYNSPVSPVSGNCYKVRLLLAQLALEYETMDVSVVRSTRTCAGARGRLTMYDRTRRND